MNNCGLADARLRASEKDLPALANAKFSAFNFDIESKAALWCYQIWQKNSILALKIRILNPWLCQLKLG